jgi:hypothetical protein
MDVCYKLREYIRQELQDSNLTIEWLAFGYGQINTYKYVLQ